MPAKKKAPFLVRSGGADGAAWAALPGRKELLVPLAPGPGGTQGARGAVRTEGLQRAGAVQALALWGAGRGPAGSAATAVTGQGSSSGVLGVSAGPGWGCRHSPCRLWGRAGCPSRQQPALLLSYHSQEWLGAVGVESSCLTRGI